MAWQTDKRCDWEWNRVRDGVPNYLAGIEEWVKGIITTSYQPATLQDQLYRAAVSIPLNVAEGYGRLSARQLVQFLQTARGSAFEVGSCLRLAGEDNRLPALQTIIERINDDILLQGKRIK